MIQERLKFVTYCHGSVNVETYANYRYYDHQDVQYVPKTFEVLQFVFLDLKIKVYVLKRKNQCSSKKFVNIGTAPQNLQQTHKRGEELFQLCTYDYKHSVYSNCFWTIQCIHKS